LEHKKMETRTMNPDRLQQVARASVDTILASIQREYPNLLRHTMTGPEDRPTPRQVHPAFYGCYDWHSSVNMHWALVRLLHLEALAQDHDRASAILDEHLTPPNLVAEAQYLQQHPGFERPYGWGWALMLANELHDLPGQPGARWAATIRPLAQLIADLIVAWLARATYPNRDGLHSNSAFGLARSMPWARRLAQTGDPRLLEAITAAAWRWYGQDRNYPAAWEPGGSDFLSPALTEAELMSATLAPTAFAAWLADFLPGLLAGQPASLFTPAIVTEPADGQGAHLHGLNLYRAFAFRHISQTFPSNDHQVQLLQDAAERHAAASLPAIAGSGYMVEHWLASYAVLYAGLGENRHPDQ
jgi:hypothetical protein